MPNRTSTSAREELMRLREEGKITNAEYQNLLAALETPAGAARRSDRDAEPQFQAFRQRSLTGALAICVISLPVEFALRLPYLWILSVAGIVVGAIKLKRIEGSWLAELLARRNRR